jgi:hypothetical protein
MRRRGRRPRRVVRPREIGIRLVLGAPRTAVRRVDAACAAEVTIHDYLSVESRCQACGAGFNPRCRHHDHLYFTVSQSCETVAITKPRSEEMSR